MASVEARRAAIRKASAMVNSPHSSPFLRRASDTKPLRMITASDPAESDVPAPMSPRPMQIMAAHADGDRLVVTISAQEAGGYVVSLGDFGSDEAYREKQVPYAEQACDVANALLDRIGEYGFSARLRFSASMNIKLQPAVDDPSRGTA